jgi:hypothetical protein
MLPESALVEDTILQCQLGVTKLQELALTAYYLDPNAYTKLWMDTEIRMKPILENLQQK